MRTAERLPCRASRWAWPRLTPRPGGVTAGSHASALQGEVGNACIDVADRRADLRRSHPDL